jgi:hypothetical protein
MMLLVLVLTFWRIVQDLVESSRFAHQIPHRPKLLMMTRLQRFLLDVLLDHKNLMTMTMVIKAEMMKQMKQMKMVTKTAGLDVASSRMDNNVVVVDTCLLNNVTIDVSATIHVAIRVESTTEYQSQLLDSFYFIRNSFSLV